MIIVLSLTTLAHAVPTLDYQASADNCPDADRFSDEVSARLGLTAFAPGGDALTVRILPLGEETIGTLEFAGGSKAVRGSACGRVFDDLVTAAAVALDTSPAPPAAAPEAAPPPAPAAVKDVAYIQVETSQDNVQIAQITGRGVGTGRNSEGTVTVQTTYYEDLCNAPCALEIAPGMVELSAYGKGHRAALEKFDLRAGDHVTLRAEPGSAALAFTAYGFAVIGLTGLVSGGTIAAASIDEQTTNLGWAALVGGGLLTAASIPVRIASRGTFTREDPGQIVLDGTF